MPPKGVLSIAIRDDFWQPQKKRKKSRINQVLTSACCPRQNEHIDIKRVATTMSRPFYNDAKKATNVSFIIIIIIIVVVVIFFFFFFLFVTLFFHAISQDLLQIQTSLIPFRPADVPFGDYKTEAKDLRGIFGCKIDFWL